MFIAVGELGVVGENLLLISIRTKQVKLGASKCIATLLRAWAGPQNNSTGGVNAYQEKVYFRR